MRSLAFAIGDGALPGNEGRLCLPSRRLLRRAVMHGRRLGISDAFLYKLVPTVGKNHGKLLPRSSWRRKTLSKKSLNVKKKPLHVLLMQVRACLMNFLLTLRKSSKDTLEGKDIFKLYDCLDSQWN